MKKIVLISTSIIFTIVLVLVLFYLRFGDLNIILPSQESANELVDVNISIIGDVTEPYIDYDKNTQKVVEYEVVIHNKSKYAMYPIKQSVDIENCYYDDGFDGVRDVTLNPNETVTNYNYVIFDKEVDENTINEVIKASGKNHIQFTINYRDYEITA